MDIIDALKSDEENVRLDNRNKWLVFDNMMWVVYGHKYGAKKTVILIETGDEKKAVTELLKKW